MDGFATATRLPFRVIRDRQAPLFLIGMSGFLVTASLVAFFLSAENGAFATDGVGMAVLVAGIVLMTAIELLLIRMLRNGSLVEIMPDRLVIYPFFPPVPQVYRSVHIRSLNYAFRGRRFSLTLDVDKAGATRRVHLDGAAVNPVAEIEAAFAEFGHRMNGADQDEKW
jgi:hypothetical protein